MGLLYITDEESHLFCFEIFEWDRGWLSLGSKINVGNIICLYNISFVNLWSTSQDIHWPVMFCYNIVKRYS